jgi:hypothetical protein
LSEQASFSEVPAMRGGYGAKLEYPQGRHS